MKRFLNLFRLVLWSVVLVVAVREILTVGYLATGEPEPIYYTLFTHFVAIFAVYRIYTLTLGDGFGSG